MPTETILLAHVQNAVPAFDHGARIANNAVARRQNRRAAYGYGYGAGVVGAGVAAAAVGTAAAATSPWGYYGGGYPGYYGYGSGSYYGAYTSGYPGYYGGVYANRSYVTGRPTLIPRRYAW